MSYYTAAVVLFLSILFVLNILFLFLGYHYAIKSRLHQHLQKESSMQIIDGSMLALPGLLLAFTFSSAVNKFDQRRHL